MTATRPLPPFQELIDAHAGAVAAFLHGMLPVHAAEDAIQETFVAALRAYPGFDGVNPRGWLLTIARRKAIDEYRASARRPGTLAEPDAIASARSQEDGGPGGTELWAAVAELPPKQRAAIVLRFALDLRYRDVGAAIGCSEAAARRSVHEGVRRLRDGYAKTKEGQVTR
jgi:RNA polymerase sigma factor (sigma-70 family)